MRRTTLATTPRRQPYKRAAAAHWPYESEIYFLLCVLKCRAIFRPFTAVGSTLRRVICSLSGDESDWLLRRRRLA